MQKNDESEAEDGKKSQQTNAAGQKSPASQPRTEVEVNGLTTPSRSPPASGTCESPESCSTERSSDQRRRERAITMEERKKKLHAEALDKKLQGVSWSKKQEEEEAEKKKKVRLFFAVLCVDRRLVPRCNEKAMKSTFGE